MTGIGIKPKSTTLETDVLITCSISSKRFTVNSGSIKRITQKRFITLIKGFSTKEVTETFKLGPQEY